MAKFCGKCGRSKLPVLLAIAFLCVIITGVVYANHKGLISIPILQNSELEKQDESIETSNQEENFSPEAVYASILKTYKNEFSNNYHTENKDEGDEYDISKVNPELRLSFGGIESPLSYCYYDISNDGVPELIICVDYGEEDNHHIVDMFGCENGTVKRLFGLQTFSARVKYSIYPNGIIGSDGSGGALYSEKTYYSLKKNSAIPKMESNLSIEHSDNETKYYMGVEENQREITESEYNTTVSQFGEEVTLQCKKLCESKLYEAEFSVRGYDGINQGYQQLFVTNETSDELTVVYRQVGEDGYPRYVDQCTTFKVKKTGETSAVKWLDGSGNEFTGTVSYHDNCFSLTYETASVNSAIKKCTGADLLYKSSSDIDISTTISTPSTEVPPAESHSADFTPDSLWATLVNNEWIDQDGNKIKFAKNNTYYKLKPNAVHTDNDYYMGTLSTTDSRGYYYGHYLVTDDNELSLEFNTWPNGDIGLLLSEHYYWDPNLEKENSWCMTSDGRIVFSQGDYSFCNKTYYSHNYKYFNGF